jgi:hypothetical protein
MYEVWRIYSQVPVDLPTVDTLVIGNTIEDTGQMMFPFEEPARYTDTFTSPAGAEQKILTSPVSLAFVEKMYQFEDPGAIDSMICVPDVTLA